MGLRSDQLQSHILEMGQTIFIPSGYYHRVKHIGSQEGTSRALELMSKSEPGHYEIHRISAAVPGIPPD